MTYSSASHPASNSPEPPGSSGKAYLVGSGPGNLAYLTLRGYQLLTQAEVLIYDALVDAELLQIVTPACQQIDVGKRGGQPSMKQPEIDQLLVEQVLAGKQVVRLKSGDPFIFGRSSSEIQALKAAGCDFEVVPGVSSALAAPLLASIPLTDPVLSRCFAVLSAHDPDALDWETLANVETLVILMGTQNLPVLVEQLLRHERSPHTPIAIIRWAGHPQQQIWVGTLETIVQQTARQELSPAVITIGEVVGLRPYLQSPSTPQNSLQQPPFVDLYSNLPTVSEISSSSVDRLSNLASETLPLQGKTVLVTRAAGQSSQFTRLLQQRGAQVIEMPALEIGPPSRWEALDQAIAHLNEFAWLVLTSTNGVDYFFERLTAQGLDARALAGVKIAVVGQKTAASLEKRGLQADYIPPNFVADSLVEHFPEPPEGLKILFPRVETGGREVLVQEFTVRGADVVEVAAYQSGCAKAIAPDVWQAFQQERIDVITFASSKTVQCFCQLWQAQISASEPLSSKQPPLSTESAASTATPLPLLNSIAIASIGPQTSASCLQHLGRVDIEAEEYTLEGLANAIAQWSAVPGQSV